MRHIGLIIIMHVKQTVLYILRRSRRFQSCFKIKVTSLAECTPLHSTLRIFVLPPSVRICAINPFGFLALPSTQRPLGRKGRKAKAQKIEKPFRSVERERERERERGGRGETAFLPRMPRHIICHRSVHRGNTLTHRPTIDQYHGPFTALDLTPFCKVG